MRPRINNRNVNYFLRQEFGFNSSGQLFEKTEHHPALREKVVRKVIQEFTNYHFKEGRLTTLNPYTNKFETLKITSFNHVTSKEELLKELSTLHRARMKMLEQSRKKIISLSKKKDREKDLDAMVSPRDERMDELKQIVKDQEENQNIGR